MSAPRSGRAHLALGLALALALALGTTAATEASATPVAAQKHAHEHAQQQVAPSTAPEPELVPPAAAAQLLRQPSGFSFRATLTPATQGGLFETTAGYSVQRDSSGTWRYVTGRDTAGRPRLSGVAVSAAAPPAGLAPRSGRATVKVSRQEQLQHDSIQRQLQIVAYQAQIQAAKAGQPRVFRVPALLFATWWDADKGQTAPQFQDGHDPAYFKKMLDGFGGNPRGSMTQFYYEASFGQFLVKVDVFGPYTSDRSREDRCYYGNIGDNAGSDLDPVGSTLGVGGGGALGMALEAVPQANADPAVDWSVYDNDGDGRVDFTMIIHSGGDMAATGNPCFTWSHALQATLGQGEVAESAAGLPHGTLAHSGIPTSSPGVFIDRVLTIPEFASKVDPLTIGVASHEMAHAIGEPDYYDTSYNSVGTGDYDLMSGGSYLGSPSGSNPAMMNPATRVFQGWITPTVVHGNLRNYTLRPRTALPRKGYRVGMPDRNLLLVPTYEIGLGATDKLGHTWGEDDVFGLAKDPRTKKFIVEGYYVENVSRNATSTKLSGKNPMGSMFDRKQHGSGLIVWHFDYWRQSTTYFAHSNNAQNDPNRYQMDFEEFDRNENTQELQLNYSRGNPADYLIGAATGITSGTRQLPPHQPKSTSKPQGPADISGVAAPLQDGMATFTVDPNPANLAMTVTAGSDNPAGDCTLSLTDPNGKKTPTVDSGGAGAAESITTKQPTPGEWTATVGDFAGCGSWSGRVLFTGAGGFVTSGAADTWSNWTQKPTGWAFTNVSGYGNGLDESNEAGGSGNVTLDVMNFAGSADVSPGFVTGRINVGRRNRLRVPVFSNGGKAPGKVLVQVHRDSATGPLVASRTVRLGRFQRRTLSFRFSPRYEGPVRLLTVVDPNGRVREGSERNQTQATDLWSGPASPKVLLVDDDQTLSHERAIAGALAVLGVPYALSGPHPSAATMRRYSAVIWESAVDRGQGQLDKYDRAALRAYLDRGGKLLVTSNRIFDALGAPQSSSNPQGTDENVQFAAQYLGERIPEGNSTYVVVQEDDATVTGKGLLGGHRLRIHPAAARPFIGLAGLTRAGNGGLGTTIAPFGTATGIATLSKSTMAAVQPAADRPYIGIAVNGDKKHHRFKTVTLGWNLGEDNNAADTVRLVSAVLKHFGVAQHRSSVRSPQPIVFHTPVRDQVSGRDTLVTAIVLGGTGRPDVVLHYRRHARGGFYTVRMRPSGAKGTYLATIPGRAFTPEGVDYFISSGRALEPYGALGGPLYHGVAVSLPYPVNPLPIKR